MILGAVSKAVKKDIEKKHEAYKQIIDMIKSYTKQKSTDVEIGKRLKKIVEIENSFLLGITETFSNNLDYIFRYLYVVAYLLQIAGHYV